MNRRRFVKQSLQGSVAFAGYCLEKKSLGLLTSNRPTGASFELRVDPKRTIAVIPRTFMGLGYEISSVAQPGLLSDRNAVYLRLVRTLSSRGVIRVGGNTSDYASYSPDGPRRSAPKATIIDRQALRDLGRFLAATDWQLIWGLNLGSGSREQAVEEAQAVADAAGDRLLAFEIGNEPDLFSHKQAHRPQGYGYAEYLREFRSFRDAISEKIPNVPLAGPDAALATDWVERFAMDEKGKICLLTHHYYREGQNPASTIDKLLLPDPKLAPMLTRLRAASIVAGVPFRICEVNSFSGGGRVGVSDTFGSALWVLDFMFRLASFGCSGVNIETGLNQLGFVSSYSPIGDDEHGHYSAKPVYYGMLAFEPACGGDLLDVSYKSPTIGISAYAVRRRDGAFCLAFINKDLSVNARAEILVPGMRSGETLRLVAPSVDSKTGVTFAGSSVAMDGTWEARYGEQLRMRKGRAFLDLPAISAAIVQISVK